MIVGVRCLYCGRCDGSFGSAATGFNGPTATFYHPYEQRGEVGVLVPVFRGARTPGGARESVCISSRKVRLPFRCPRGLR